MGPALRKLDCDCAPPRTAAIHWVMLGAIWPGWGGGGGIGACLRILFSGISRGLTSWKPARILPLLPTNIMPSASSSWLSISNSGGVGGRIPPSYQNRSSAGLSPREGYLKRTELAVGKEKSFCTLKGTPSLNSQV